MINYLDFASQLQGSPDYYTIKKLYKKECVANIMFTIGHEIGHIVQGDTVPDDLNVEIQCDRVGVFVSGKPNTNMNFLRLVSNDKQRISAFKDYIAMLNQNPEQANYPIMPSVA